MKALNVHLTYKLGGFTDKDNIKLLTDSVSPGSTSGSKFIPDENYKILFRTSNPVESFYYSGVLIERNTDISSDGGSLKTTGGALFIVDGINEYKIENIYGSSQYGDVGYAVEKQSDGSYLLANKYSQNWEFVSISAQGIISDEPSIFTTDITDYEILINEDLDNDGAIALNLNALTDVTYDDSGYQLKYDGDGSIYIWDGSDINTIISVVNDAGSSPIYEYSELALNVITIVGMVTAIFAATVALVQTDIKKIIAYSTCSQLGYMFFAAGVGAYNVAMFHLFTHAFFKALLFLGAGAVIHSFHDEQDINKMGGVIKKLPYTYVLMLIGTLALTGFPFLSGFYSKDAIIEFAYLRGNGVGMLAAFVGIVTALLTSIYSWRLIFKTFHGNFNNKELSIDKVHESPFVMIAPLIILAIGAIFAGMAFKGLFIGHEIAYEFWAQSIKFLEPLSTDHPPTWFLFLTPILVTAAIPFSYYLYLKNTNIVNGLKEMNEPIYQFLVKKWYFDEMYDYLFVNPSKKIGKFLWKKVDGSIIDKFGPDGISSVIKNLSIKAVKFQSGFIYQYAFVMLIGFSVLLTILILN